jgi:hypothetical protein
MSVERTPISKLFDATERYKIGRLDLSHEDAFQNYADTIGIFDQNGVLVAAVQEDNLFDPYGNRFYMDE